MAAEMKDDTSTKQRTIWVAGDDKGFGYWQLCPKCNGEKVVSDYDHYTITWSTRPCGICAGVGILARPVIDKQ